MRLRGAILFLGIVLVIGCQAGGSPPTPSPPESSMALTVTATATAAATAVPAPTDTPEAAEEATAVTEEELNLDEANVTFVEATQAGDGTWRFAVTVRHGDEGWDHYADGWDVVLPDGTVLKRNAGDQFTRVLLHPHENEQPFTRSQSGLAIPEGVTEVTVRAHCNVHGFGGRDVVVNLTAERGPDFEVAR